MTRALVESSRFSPGNMTPEALEGLFVGREKLITEVLKNSSTAATGGDKHFMLLVGPRGMGKTHFMALLHQRLTTQPAFEKARRRLKTAYLREEEWGVASFLDFLVRILRALASQDSRLTASIELIPQLFARDAQAALREAEKLIIDHVGDGVLLLLCENLNELFAGIGEEGQKRFRAFIHEHPFWTIVATTPSLFTDVQRQRWPFYGFFTIRYMDRLDVQTATDLLTKKARLEGKAELAEFLRTPTGQARVRAIHHLAGGNHRVYVILSDFLDRQSLDDLVTPFLRMVDDLTPYYQDRIRQLSPQQRKLVEHLCHQSRPLPVKEIAMACLMSQQTAAKQLGELARLGFVLRSDRGRETLCEITEPLLRICIEVKDNQTSHLKLFVEFLRHWYTRKEMEARFETIPSTDTTHAIDRLHLEVAIHACRQDLREPFLDALDHEAMSRWESGDFAGLAEAATRLVEDRGQPVNYVMLVTALVKCKRVEEAMSRGKEGVKRHPRNASLRISYANALYEARRYENALFQLDHAIPLARGNDLERARCCRGTNLLRLKRYEEALANEAELLRTDPSHAHSYWVKAEALIGLSRYAEAEASARDGLLLGEHLTYFFQALGNALWGQKRFEESLGAYDRVLVIAPDNVAALCSRVGVLIQVRRFQEALDSSERLRALDSKHFDEPHFRDRYLEALIGTNRFIEAETVARKILETEPARARTWNNLGIALASQGHRSEALDAFGRALDLAPDNRSARSNRQRLLLELRRWGALLKDTDTDLEKGARGADVQLFRAEALLGLHRYADALAAATRAQEAQADDVAPRLVQCRAIVGVEGFASAVRAFESFSEVSGTPATSLAATLADMMSIEIHERGPVALARQLPLLQSSLGSIGREALLVEAFPRFIRYELESPHFGGPDWSLAMTHFVSLQDVAALRIPIEMLTAAVRHRSGDTGALLALPLEQRQLIENMQTIDRPSQTDSSTSAPSESHWTAPALPARDKSAPVALPRTGPSERPRVRRPPRSDAH